MTHTPTPVGSRWSWLPLLALLPLAFTLLGWQQSVSQAEVDIRKELNASVNAAARSMEDELLGYAHLLEGGRGLLAASGKPQNNTWVKYVSHVNTNARFKGLQSVGYSEKIKDTEVRSSAQKRKTLDPAHIPMRFQVGGDVYVMVASQIYSDTVMPKSRDGEVFEIDEVRQDVIMQAIDRGAAVISPPLQLENANHKGSTLPALLMVLPWYGNEQPSDMLQRRKAVRGILYAAWQAKPMMDAVHRQQVMDYPFRVYDAQDPTKILYEDQRWGELADSAGTCLGYSESATVSTHGRSWRMQICDNRAASSMPAYLQAHRWLSLGTIATFLLLGIGYWMLRQRSDTLSSAEKIQIKHMDVSHRLRNIATRVPVLIAHLDTDCRYLFANELYLKWFGIDQSQMEGLRPEEVFGEELGGNLARNVQRALEGETFRQEVRMETRSFDIHYTPEIDDGGQVIGAYVVASDISKHKQMERHLSDEKERLEVTLTSIGEAVVSFDPNGIVLYSNPAANALMKAQDFSMVGGRGQDVLRFLDGTGLPMDSHPLVGVLLDGEKRTYSDLLIETNDQALVPVEATLSAMKDAEGHIIGAAVVIRDVSKSREMSHNLRHMAHHDALTGLANRVEIHSRIDDLLANPKQEGALVFIDLDHFKNINDTLGHEVGDSVLREVAERIRSVVGATGSVARQGGDEFLVLLPGITQHRAEKTSAKILEELVKPIRIEQRTMRIAASAGIATFPQDGVDRIEIMRQADAAMYAAKRSGRNQAVTFEPQMSAYAEERMSIEQGLRDALSNDGLVVFYQPKIDASSNTMAGYEALVRWNKDGQLLQPNSFIHIAEECGLVGAVDAWVMLEACRQQARWLAEGLAPLTCSTNISMAWLDGATLLRSLDEALSETGIPAHLLQLEFTETQVMHDGDQARLLIQELRKRGVSVALDDFGTGYSNLSSLNSFGFDTVKVDRSFIQEMTDPKRLSLVRAIISIGKAHGHTIVAEGVETEAQASILTREGCHQMQGFLYSKPVDAKQISTWLAHPFKP